MVQARAAGAGPVRFLRLMWPYHTTPHHTTCIRRRYLPGGRLVGRLVGRVVCSLGLSVSVVVHRTHVLSRFAPPFHRHVSVCVDCSHGPGQQLQRVRRRCVAGRGARYSRRRQGRGASPAFSRSRTSAGRGRIHSVELNHPRAIAVSRVCVRAGRRWQWGARDDRVRVCLLRACVVGSWPGTMKESGGVVCGGRAERVDKTAGTASSSTTFVPSTRVGSLQSVWCSSTVKHRRCNPSIVLSRKRACVSFQKLQ